MTVNHFVILIKHMWKKDWHQYRHGRILVQDHAAYMLFIYSSGRVGEYFESNMRRGSGCSYFISSNDSQRSSALLKQYLRIRRRPCRRSLSKDPRINDNYADKLTIFLEKFVM